jgi:cytochrome c oxidase cbb3-type subunit 3
MAAVGMPVVLLALSMQACRLDSTDSVARGSIPSNAYFVGPQPGPERAFPPVNNPHAGDTRVLPEARRAFGYFNCSGCHGTHAGGGMGPSLRDSSWIYGGDASSIFASISEGRQHGMPAWGSKLSQDQIWKLVTYIQSLRTPNEPDPPR